MARVERGLVVDGKETIERTDVRARFTYSVCACVYIYASHRFGAWLKSMGAGGGRREGNAGALRGRVTGDEAFWRLEAPPPSSTSSSSSSSSSSWLRRGLVRIGVCFGDPWWLRGKAWCCKGRHGARF